MSKVTVRSGAESPTETETPTQAVVRAANAVVEATDSRGRTWGVKKLGPLARLQLFKVLGADLSENRMFMGTCALAASVVSVDGEPIAPASSLLKLEGLVDRLGDEGLEAIGKAIADNFGVKEDDDLADAAKN